MYGSKDAAWPAEHVALEHHPGLPAGLVALMLASGLSFDDGD